MKKTIIFFWSLIITLAHAEGPIECDKSEESLSPLEKKVSTNFKKIYSSTIDTVCNDNLFLSSKDPKYNGVHNEERCDEIKLCLEGSKDKVSSKEKESKEIVDKLIKEAALVSIIEQELNFGLRYNQKSGKLEAPLKPKNCPVEKVPEECSALIDRVVASLGKDYFLSDKPVLGSGKKQLKKNCDEYVGLGKICQKAQERVQFIVQCEKYSDGCLELEQKALGALVNNYRRDNDLFLAMENELCLPKRVVKPRVQVTSVAMEKMSLADHYKKTRLKSRSSLPLGNALVINPPELIKEVKTDVSHSEDPKEIEGPPAPGSTGPDGSVINSIGELKFDNSIKVQDQPAEEIKGPNNGEFTLSEKFSNSMNDALRNDVHASNNAEINSGWGNNFSTQNYSLGTNDFKTEPSTYGSGGKIDKPGLQDSSVQKKEEINALIGQINTLKEKLEEMNSRMEELKDKKETEKSQTQDKEVLEREKSILELKKKLAELEADKKRLVAQEEARAKEEQKKNSATDRKNQENSSWKVNSLSNNSQDNSNISRDNSSAGPFIQASASMDVARSPASAYTQASPQNNSSLILKSSSEGGNELPPVVYMTAVELQKYPYRLNDNASSGDIEKMILNNNGAVIIVGESEQIVPVVEKGIVQLDESGRVKYRRVKISLVKNDKERKRNQARDISSVADLKREEQKRRDLIRYQEMKKAMEKATDH